VKSSKFTIFSLAGQKNLKNTWEGNIKKDLGDTGYMEGVEGTLSS
jgi:hypothetical protein